MRTLLFTLTMWRHTDMLGFVTAALILLVYLQIHIFEFIIVLQYTHTYFLWTHHTILASFIHRYIIKQVAYDSYFAMVLPDS